ncbi:hypothetical protein NOR_05102 [Metarhizium rileyi]|uniref:Uncharacterized protein n=1 Tax=Metarhizium rileyi (strain RCEF 4871) TaxID=1649241 RepID=A0A162JHT6_METRR|nr:hypothetical protein NOR_05102 [Metarhizium rileyi RCEF 4871]
MVTSLTKRIGLVKVHGWVAEETSGTEADALSLIVRMVWIDVDPTDKVIRQSEQTTKILVDVFGLEIAYGYARSCVSGVAALPGHVHAENSHIQPFCFCYPPKMAAVWAQRLVAKTNDIRGVEKRTGYHKRSEGELEELLAKTSGSASKLASTSRKSKVLEKLLSFTNQTLEEFETRDQAQRQDATRNCCQATPDSIDVSPLEHSVLRSHVSVLKDRQEMQCTDIEYTLTRVQVQSDALFNIIQQSDANSSLELFQFSRTLPVFRANCLL